MGETLRREGPQAHRHDFPPNVEEYGLGALHRCACGEVRALHSEQRDGKFWDTRLNDEEATVATAHWGRGDQTTQQWRR